MKCGANESAKNAKYIRVRLDKGQLEMLNKWNRLGFQFEPNYQVRTDNRLYYLDGYDPKHNVVFEYDSKYHKNPAKKQADLIRQKKIINRLAPCAFWRYDAENHSFNNVIVKENK